MLPSRSLSLSPTHTDTHASLYNGCFTLVPGRETEREREMEERGRGRDMVRRREWEGETRGCGREVRWSKKKETAIRQEEEGGGGGGK